MQQVEEEGAAAMRLLALSIALRHPALSTYPQVLCTAATVSKNWQQAVQQCGACSTVVQPKLSSKKQGIALPKIASFASWLPKHGSLVSSITVTPAATVPSSSSGLTWQEFNEAAMQLLQLAVQLAAVVPATGALRNACMQKEPETEAPGSSTALGIRRSAPHQQQQQQQGLHIASFSSSAPGATSMLAVLPPHRLTHLYLDVRSSRMINSNAMSAALAQLTSLQNLILVDASTECFSRAPRSCLTAVPKLSQLTHLKLVGCWLDAGDAAGTTTGGMCSPLQQLLSQALPLRQLELGLPLTPRAVLDMARLTRLEGLTTAAGFASGSVLPEQLQGLRLGHCDHSSQLAAVLQLQQLTGLSLSVGFRQQQPLLQLAQMTSLKQLQLAYVNAGAAAATAPAWGQMPQLQALRTSCQTARQQTAAVLAGLAGATNLTSLRLEVPLGAAQQTESEDEAGAEEDDDDEEEEDDSSSSSEEEEHDGEQEGQGNEALSVCACLANLSQLECLCLDSLCLPAGDALALTKLTGLKVLQLLNMGAGCDDLAANALACSLSQLESLTLNNCELGSMVCVAGIAHLTQLTQLNLDGGGLTQQQLMLLTRLSRLQQLEVDRSREVTDAVVGGFWTFLRRCKSV